MNLDLCSITHCGPSRSCFLCFDRFDQKSVCFDHLNSSLIIFDCVRPKKIISNVFDPGETVRPLSTTKNFRPKNYLTEETFSTKFDRENISTKFNPIDICSDPSSSKQFN